MTIAELSARIARPSAAEAAAPLAPQTLEETGLAPALVADLALKHLNQLGQCLGSDLARALCLPMKIIEPVLDVLKRDHLVEVTGGSGIAAATYVHTLSSVGLGAAKEVLARSPYVGPAPVTLTAYTARIRAQSRRDVAISFADLREAVAHLVLPERTLRQLGPAVNSGTSVFLFGPPGVGKSSIAESFASLNKGGMVVPHAIQVGAHVIRVYDPSRHDALVTLDARYDRRWIPVSRPFVKVGGELTLNDLDLSYDALSGSHEAPIQVKANGGVLLIDDFGRQRASAEELLNRWIVPLDRGVDYLTLADGRKIEVPFDLLLVFATNRTPSSLVDEAFLRRIQYKVALRSPTDAEFAEIMRRLCEREGIEFHPQAADWIVRYCRARAIPVRSCYPRDLLRHIAAAARFLEKPVEITPELVALACETYFLAESEPTAASPNGHPARASTAPQNGHAQTLIS